MLSKARRERKPSEADEGVRRVGVGGHVKETQESARRGSHLL